MSMPWSGGSAHERAHHHRYRRTGALAYASDWKDFAVWCLARGATSLPAHQGIVAAYLSSLAGAGKKASTINPRAAAIARSAQASGLRSPTSAEGVKATLRGIRRTIGSAKQGKAPATDDLARTNLWR